MSWMRPCRRASSSSSTESACTLIFETNGGSKINSLSVERGTRVSLSKYTPKRTGYTFAGWYLDKKLTDRVTSVKVDSSMSVYAKLCGYDVSDDVSLRSYKDAQDVSSWAEDAMQWAVGAGLINGRTKTTLVPQGKATRAEVAAILMRFLENVAE